MCGGAQWVSNKVATPGQPHQRASNMDFVTTQCEDIGCKSGRSESPSLASDISSCWLQYQNIKDILTAAREMCMVYSGDGLGNWFYSAVFFPKPPPPPRSAPPCIYENGKPVDTPLPTDIDRIAWAKEGVAKHNERRKELGITGIPDIMFNPKMCGAAQWVTNKYAIPGDPFLFASEMDSVSMQCAEFNCALGPSTTSPPASVISGCWLDNFSHVDRARVIEVLIAAREMCITYTHDGQAAFFYTVHFYPPPPKPHDPGAVVNPEGRSGFYTTPTPRSKTPRPKPQLAPPPPPVASYTFVV